MRRLRGEGIRRRRRWFEIVECREIQGGGRMGAGHPKPFCAAATCSASPLFALQDRPSRGRCRSPPREMAKATPRNKCSHLAASYAGLTRVSKTDACVRFSRRRRPEARVGQSLTRRPWIRGSSPRMMARVASILTRRLSAHYVSSRSARPFLRNELSLAPPRRPTRRRSRRDDTSCRFSRTRRWRPGSPPSRTA